MSIRSRLTNLINPGYQAHITDLTNQLAELSNMLDDLADQVTENEELLTVTSSDVTELQDDITRIDNNTGNICTDITRIEKSLMDPDECFRNIIESHTSQLDEIWSRLNDQDGIPGEFSELQGELDMLATALTNRLTTMNSRIADDETVLTQLLQPIEDFIYPSSDDSDGWLIPGLVGIEDL
jgi:chromosome segregation ATPase